MTGDKATAWTARLEDKLKVQEITAKAEAGDAVSMLHIGVLHTTGSSSMVQNNLEAFRWIQRSADSGNHEALPYLGACHIFGVGVEPNPTFGVAYFVEGATLGAATGCAFLAERFIKGEYGLPRDFSQATKWYRKMQECKEISVTAAVKQTVADWLRDHAVE